MPKLPFLCLISLLLAGCVAPAIPDGYTGPTARVFDSTLPSSSRKCDFFVLRKVDSNQIADSILETQKQNEGRGLYMTPAEIARDVMADKPTKLTLLGLTVYASDGLAMVNRILKVEGEVTVTLKANHKYEVKGVLAEGNSSVWIEDLDDHEVLGKIENHASSKLGLFSF